MKETKVVLVVERRGLSLAVGEVTKDRTSALDEQGRIANLVMDVDKRIARALNLRDGQYRISVERIGDV